MKMENLLLMHLASPKHILPPFACHSTHLTKVFTVSYFNGTWIDFGTFGVNASGGV